ncbi:TIGR02270 family protein [Psychromonas sp. Urea-02u-13]|uniref:TIGR02270 family protein n=1 Tax=Psychromonas sp. Urea-02u-13 TaxID=2058326 RepID=UPI0012FF0AEB|nr:TIGR02270 family protein [Psychromonas sp. Urea-02u-13]
MFSSTNTLQKSAHAYRDISEQFVIDASFLWLLRSISVKQPHYYLTDLADLEKRIDANLDGLMCNFELAWEICLEELRFDQAGEAFTATIIAFRSRDVNKIKVVIDHAFVNDDTFKGVASAMAWLPKPLIREWLERFLFSKDLNHKQLAIAFCSITRKNPGECLKEFLQREDCLSHIGLLKRVVRLIGELKLYAFGNALLPLAEHEDIDVKFWANWSIVMLGEHKYAANLQAYLLSDSPFSSIAQQVIFKVLPIDKARLLISDFATQPERLREVIQASGLIGDPHTVPWIIDKMNNFDTAKVAGEAFTLITGIDLDRYELSIEPPEDIAAVPNDEHANSNVDLDEDENLPFPNVSKINHTWLHYRARYKAGSRYIMGIEVNQNNPATVAKLTSMLKQAGQRQRASIALTLALLDPQSSFVNVKARSLV